MGLNGAERAVERGDGEPNRMRRTPLDESIESSGTSTAAGEERSEPQRTSRPGALEEAVAIGKLNCSDEFAANGETALSGAHFEYIYQSQKRYIFEPAQR